MTPRNVPRRVPSRRSIEPPGSPAGAPLEEVVPHPAPLPSSAENPAPEPVAAERRGRLEPGYREMGDRLRAERRSHGLSLRELADRLGVSPSLISQVETGRAQPSVSTLYAIAAELGVSLDDLLFTARPDLASRRSHQGRARDPESPPPVQRAGDRKRIRLASGVTWDRLTTSSEPGIEFLYVTYEVGGASGPEDVFQRHQGHEWGYVVSGTLHVTIGFEDYVLGAGDSISIDSMIPHRLSNRGPEPVHGIWFVLGRHAPTAAGTADHDRWLDPLHGGARSPR
jgi:transcriptional regulator with XRE-family HTH domain